MAKPELLIAYIIGLLAVAVGAGGSADMLDPDWEAMGIGDSRGAGPRLSARFLLMSSLRGMHADAKPSAPYTLLSRKAALTLDEFGRVWLGILVE